MKKRGRRYQVAQEKVDPGRVYSPSEAMRLVKETVSVSHDPTVDLAVRLGIDTRRADQMVRGSVVLPHGTGKQVRVAVFAEGAKAEEAGEAGADIIGAERIVPMIEAGDLSFDAVIATPDQMGKVGRFGKVLGPRGLMPNPKTGTVTTDVATVVAQVKAGKIEYRADRQGNVHVVLGKASFDARQLVDNYAAVLDDLLRARPAAAKGRYLRSIHVSSSQGPSIPVDPQRTRVVWEEEQPAA
ncbi:MAG: 50S ribosomal protein L1 [Actinomycetota bacterium]|nr:50S ribosomal protein L1 [Actinomycetota bacterium]